MLALLPGVSVERLKAWGANGVKILLSYTPFDDPRANDEKRALIERIGEECAGAGLPFLLEFVGYDAQGSDEAGLEFARLKPEIVIRSMQEFSRDIYNVDVMKVQVPVNAQFMEGSCVYKGCRAYSYAEALELYRRASDAAGKPFVYLSAGVSHKEFTESLRMATEAGAEFSGIVCGRATWKDGIPVYARYGVHALEDWLADRGVKNIRAVNELVRGAVPWHNKLLGAFPALPVAESLR
jgi:tagatose 1,6-diphosphate aldolase